MKTGILVVIFIALLSSGYADGNIMPSTFKEVMLSDNSYEYIISKFIVCKEWGKSDSSVTSYSESLMQSSIPECTKVKVDLKKDEIKFYTKSHFNNPSEVINVIAATGALVPYWDELLARDSKSKNYIPDLYYLDDKVTSFGMYIYDWKRIPKDTPIKIPFRYEKGKIGILVFNRTVNYCVCHNRFAMRVYDETGRFIWEDLDNIYGGCLIAIHEMDDVDEMIIYRDDHGEIEFLIYRHKG